MNNSPEVSICLGAYREADNLINLLPQLSALLASVQGGYEILVIDTNPSFDNAAQVCKQFSEVRYIQREENNSYGAMVRTAIKQARGKKILFIDADGSHDPAIIPQLLVHADHYDLVIGSRYVSGGQTENSSLLKFQSWLLNTTYRIFLGIKVKDISNSLRCYRADLLKPLHLNGVNFDILEEILVKLMLENPSLTILEVPICFHKRQAGSSSRRLIPFLISLGCTLISLWWLKIRYRLTAQH